MGLNLGHSLRVGRGNGCQKPKSFIRRHCPVPYHLGRTRHKTGGKINFEVGIVGRCGTHCQKYPTLSLFQIARFLQFLLMKHPQMKHFSKCTDLLLHLCCIFIFFRGQYTYTVLYMYCLVIKNSYIILYISKVLLLDFSVHYTRTHYTSNVN